MYPKSLDSLINSFLRLPGVGKKTAERYAYSVVNKMTKEEIEKFIENLENCKTRIKKCPKCGFLTENDICDYCSDNTRDVSTILVVEEPKDVESIEKTERYHGLYHVLGGAISPLNGIGPDELNIKSLFDRVKENDSKEVIIATSATIEGEATALYIGRMLQKENVVVSRIAYGMPVGSSLEYSDESTISRAIEGRNKIEK